MPFSSTFSAAAGATELLALLAFYNVAEQGIGSRGIGSRFISMADASARGSVSVGLSVSTPRSTPTLRSHSVVVAVLIQILYDFTIVLHQKTTSGVVHAPKSSAASIKEERTRRKTSRLSGLYQLTMRSLRRCISAFLRLSPRSFRYRSIKEILPLPVSHKTTLEST